MITNLALENFKSFRCADLELGPLTLLIGPNASGKSNLRDALRFLHAVGRGYSVSECLDGKYEAGVQVWSGIRGGSQEVLRRGKLKPDRQWYPRRPKHWPKKGSTIEFRCGSHGLSFRHRLAFESPVRGQSRVLAESLYTGQEGFIFSTHPTSTSKQPHSPVTIKTWRRGRGQGGRRISLQSKEKPILPQLLVEPGVDEPVVDACEWARDTFSRLRFLDLSPTVMREYSPKEPGILGDRGENLSAAVWRLCSKKADHKLLLGWLRELTPHDIDDIGFYTSETGEVLLKIIEPGGREVSARSMSDGTLRYLALATALLSAEPEQVFFIEEIENGIHPTRLDLLVQMIQEITTRSGIQVIATTHAPLALSFLDEGLRKHAVYCSRNLETGLSETRPVMDLPHIREALEVDSLDRLLSTGWMEHVS